MSFLAIGMIRLYQRLIVPLLPQGCRYVPSCSEYMIESIEKKGLLLGVPKGIWRVLRCQPFGGQGVDLP